MLYPYNLLITKSNRFVTLYKTHTHSYSPSQLTANKPTTVIEREGSDGIRSESMNSSSSTQKCVRMNNR